MHVRFWGTRGSIPSPGFKTAVYGGNTSCIEVRAGDNTLIILDCGTGIRELGAHLMRSGQSPDRIYLLIGHTHWDHIQGFPFFSPANLPGVELHIFAPAGFERSLEDAMAGQMQYPYFPVKLQDLASRIYYNEVEEGFFRIGEVLIETQYLNHTAPALAYRITDQTTTIAYVTDHEPFWSIPGPLLLHPGDQRHVSFLKDADLLIHDAQYTAEEYRTKQGWGHSSFEYATDVAIACGARRLALFHHDPNHDDAVLQGIEEKARQRAVIDRAYRVDVDVFCAAEGQVLEVRGSATRAPIQRIPALEHPPVEGGRILLVIEDRTDAATIRAILADDGFAITTAADIHSALGMIPNLNPNIVILGGPLDTGITYYVELLRSTAGKPELPVLLLTEAGGHDQTLEIMRAGASDYIARPFGATMLRSRVRSWRARTLASSRALDERPYRAARSNTDEVLSSSALFGAMAADALARLRRNATEHIYANGDKIVRQGEHSDSMYLVLSGRVRVVEGLTISSVETVLGEFGPGEVFGELGVLMQQPRSATVFALERTRCLKIAQADFISALQDSPEMSAALLRILADRLHDTNRLLARTAPDALTGLPSRRAFHYLYRRLAAGARRRRGSAVLVALDIVQLKSINDRFGYAAGDEVLVAVANALLEFSHNTGLVARYGGDEFALLLLDADVDDAPVIVERLQSHLSQKLPPYVTCSIGYAANRVAPGTADALLQRAAENLSMTS